ncbi:MAG: amidase [Alphaproteobacteria bacterium]|nr:amidase [Alphaproteobacteria bacterium]
MTNELVQLTACEAVQKLKAGDVSPLELIDAAEARIAATDGAVNAMPTQCFERARERATTLMNSSSDGAQGPGWLAGLPIAIKDLMPVAGVRTTYGSPIFADNIPQKSDVLVDRLERQGAVVIGKTNTPEFGAGANTFNEVFGATRNPWNTDKTCAGSSGGAAVAVATGQAWLAHGSDLGGSLRTPASFCGITGLRPSPGRVPRSSLAMPFSSLAVDGPMGRDTADVALFLDAMAGLESADPLSYPAPALSYTEAVRNPDLPLRIAYSPDLGLCPVDPEVASICADAAQKFVDMGATVVEASPAFTGAQEAFHILRAAQFAADKGGLLDKHRDLVKPDLVWNIEKGRALTSEEIGHAEISRGQLYRRVVRFFEDYDLLICPTAIVPPFDVETRYIEEAGGVKFDNYMDWLTITYALTLTGCPIVSSPAGLTASGLPVGVQLVAPPRREDVALAAATLLEKAVGLTAQLPIDPRPPA